MPLKGTIPPPATVTPASVKFTVPVGAFPLTVATNVTAEPGGAGFMELDSVVVDEATATIRCTVPPRPTTYSSPAWSSPNEEMLSDVSSRTRGTPPCRYMISPVQ